MIFDHVDHQDFRSAELILDQIQLDFLFPMCFSVLTVRGFAEWKRERVEVKDDEEEDDQEVFTVELHRGPHGLGLALVDGMVRPLQLLQMLIGLKIFMFSLTLRKLN